ncbi:hypothetical protein GMOD_00001909 [Pyrenophora seminiperda CCB06]|uniref:Uncharacterized protein n=1 Tax=Pyrenophora seminiperda CCB06 TaxID=1302712 RepID=A0A3M7LWH0_9PLEO|nr:hypothetical protein GMOD_00001909 [Pyrenophora seminiperda CCB06]
MSEPRSRKDSTYSTLPTTPPTPGVNETDDSPSNHRRPSQVAELLEKTIAKLKRIFGSRRGSTEDESVPLNPYNTHRSSLSHESETQEEQAWRGAARLPNVSLYFDANGEEGPSLFYTTADWDAFQAALQARRTSSHARLQNDVQYDGDTDQDELYQSAKEKRKDLQFRFGGFLKSGRLSKIDKGKRPMVYDDTVPSPKRESLLLGASNTALEDPLDNIGIIPRPSTDEDSLFASSDVPKAEYSKAKPSYGLPKSPGLKQSPDDVLSFPLAQQTSVIRMVTPRRLHTDLVSPIGSNDSSTLSSSSDFIAAGTRRFRNIRWPSKSSMVVEDSAQTKAYRPLTHESFVTGSSSNPSLTSLRHGDRPDTAPSSPPLRPTSIPSLDAMQTLTLGPPSQALLSSSHSSEQMFRLSAEHLAASSRPSPPGSSGLARTTLVGEDEQDKMDFSITHPAPPSPVMDSIPPVRRREGSLKGSEDLRSAYVEQGGSHRQMSARAALMKARGGRLSPKKSLQGQCWWGDDEMGVSPPRQYL